MKEFFIKGLMIVFAVMIVVAIVYVGKIILVQVAKKEQRNTNSLIVTSIKKFFGGSSKNGTVPTTFWTAVATVHGKLLKKQDIQWDEFQGNKAYTFGRRASCKFVLNHESVSLNALDLYCDRDQVFSIEPYNDSSVVRIKEGDKLIPLRKNLELKEGLEVYLGDVRLQFFRKNDIFNELSDEVIKDASGTQVFTGSQKENIPLYNDDAGEFDI